MRLLIIGKLQSDISEAIDIASSQNAKVAMVASVDQALEYLCSGKGADIVLVDVKLDVKSLVEAMKQEKISTKVVAYGVESTPKEAVNAIKSGAKEFMPLPPDKRLIAAIFMAISENQTEIIGESKLFKEVLKVARKVAASDANVLITGPSGTGKEVLANYICKHSKRKDKQFVPINCAAIPKELLESECFGHEKGAFTGALNRRIGKFEESSGGTLMLDEISEMDIQLQAKLLRAIQEQEINRVGGGPVKVDLRIIATSNRNLEEEIRIGGFREDLYFRLSTIEIQLPALRERVQDIRPLAEFFIAKYVENNGMEDKFLSESALEKMQNYPWPGNIRELENVLHRAVLLSEDAEIKAGDITLKETTQAEAKKDDTSDAQVTSEKQLIFNTLGYCIGDLNKTANILGISINMLKEKLEQYSAQ